MWLSRIVWAVMNAGIAASVMAFVWDFAVHGFGSFTPVVAKSAAENFYLWAVFCLFREAAGSPLAQVVTWMSLQYMQSYISTKAQFAGGVLATVVGYYFGCAYFTLINAAFAFCLNVGLPGFTGGADFLLSEINTACRSLLLKLENQILNPVRDVREKQRSMAQSPSNTTLYSSDN